MVNSKAIIAYIVIVAIVVAVWGISTGFKLPHIGPSSSTTATTTGTTSSSTTTINSTSTSTTTINYETECSALYTYSTAINTTTVQGCRWYGGPLGLWIASGPASSSHVEIVGVSDNTIYINETSGYSCATFFRNFTAPAQNYTITLTTSNITNTSSTCGYAFAKLNTTLSPPPTIYDYVFNGNFSSGTYTGWSTAGNGFGIAPLNLTFATTSNTASCYIGAKWQNYNNTFTGTTFNCGLSNAPGNLTSSPFYAKKAFLNFRIISPQDNLLYVEILYNNTPYIIAHYNTYNSSFSNPGSNCTAKTGSNSTTPGTGSGCAAGAYTFRNASIPLVTVLNKPIQVRVVADTLNHLTFIAVEGFALASSPRQDKGVLYGSYNFTH